MTGPRPAPVPDTIPAEAVYPGGTLRVPHHRGERYVREYNRGWRCDWRDEGNEFAAGTASMAFEDGYLDRENRENQKWHLAWCRDHDNRPDGGCGMA